MDLGGNPTQGAIADYLAERVSASDIERPQAIVVPRALTPGAVDGISFLTGEGQHAEYASALRSLSSLILVTPAVYAMLQTHGRRGIIAVADPRREFARVVGRFFAADEERGVSPSANVDPKAHIGMSTRIGAGAYVAAGVVIGESCDIGANAVLLPGTCIGDNTSIGPSTTIGYAGFGYAREDDGTPVPVPHLGGVVIGSNVEIGANTCIDRGTLDDTVIGDHVKIDNLVHIAHNCRVETGAFVIATAILCGGVRIGPRAWIAPNSSILEKRSVGSDAVVGLAATVLQDVPDRATVVGSPAREVSQ